MLDAGSGSRDNSDQQSFDGETRTENDKSLDHVLRSHAIPSPFLPTTRRLVYLCLPHRPPNALTRHTRPPVAQYPLLAARAFVAQALTAIRCPLPTSCIIGKTSATGYPFPLLHKSEPIQGKAGISDTGYLAQLHTLCKMLFDATACCARSQLPGEDLCPGLVPTNNDPSLRRRHPRVPMRLQCSDLGGARRAGSAAQGWPNVPSPAIDPEYVHVDMRDSVPSLTG
ncbi:hypothetical protein GGX14DRAFT_572857 [Mycena pura]|uniref:Uncharacterized protein n=1 Tax=Mycena pura TaxID=153505 RepID=A0AAD6V141_9AGAR|nr:hypothetical protein GGX14DRAFT_572857 [Mycena pura]